MAIGSRCFANFSPAQIEKLLDLQRQADQYLLSARRSGQFISGFEYRQVVDQSVMTTFIDLYDQLGWSIDCQQLPASLWLRLTSKAPLTS